jgi:hypothetical protein
MWAQAKRKKESHLEIKISHTQDSSLLLDTYLEVTNSGTKDLEETDFIGTNGLVIELP